MAHTVSNTDKFAFLFANSTSTARYLKDIEGVYELLTDYYNYDPANIIVVQGDTAFTGTFNNLPPANKKVVATCPALRTEFNNFALLKVLPNSNLVYGSTGPNRNSVLLYFTGAGRYDTANSKSLITVNGTEEFDSDWFLSMLRTPYDPSYVPIAGEPQDNYMANLRKSYVNVVIQSDEAGALMVPVQNCSQIMQRSIICACGIDEKDTGTSSAGSRFTESWLIGLRLDEKFPSSSVFPAYSAHTGKYLDNLSLVKPNASIEFSKKFVEARTGATNIGFYNNGESEKYLGFHDILFILDGDEITTAPRDLDCSPDIWLTNSINTAAINDNCYFVTGSNDIGVRIRNAGTQPVRTLYYGIRIYRNSAPAGVDQHLPLAPQDIIIKAGSGIVLSHTHSFPADVYQDIKVRVSIVPITDLNIWDIDGNLNEAQRSIFPPLSATASVSTLILCNGGIGAVTINATGGAPPLSYTFNGSLPVATGVFSSVPYGMGLAWSVTDKYGSTLSGSIDVVQPALITGGAIVTVPITVIGGTATVQVTGTGGTGSLTYTFNGVPSSTGLFSGISAGTGHTWVITDANGCFINGTLDVASPSAITVSGSLTHVIRFGNNTGKIILTVTPGLPSDYFYSWDNGAVTKDITGLTAGFYTVTVTHILTGDSLQATFEIIHPYINIQKTVLHALEIEFKDYPVLSGVLAKRFYEVLWRGKMPVPPSLLFPKPTITTKNITVLNMVQVVISGQQWVKATISVPKGKAGLVSIKPPKLFPPFGRRTPSVPVKIYYVSQYPIIIPRRKLLIADFKIIPGPTSIDFIL